MCKNNAGKKLEMGKYVVLKILLMQRTLFEKEMLPTENLN